MKLLCTKINWTQTLAWKRFHGQTSLQNVLCHEFDCISIWASAPAATRGGKKLPETTRGRPGGVWNVDSVCFDQYIVMHVMNVSSQHTHTHHIFTGLCLFKWICCMWIWSLFITPSWFRCSWGPVKGSSSKGKQSCLWCIIHQSGALVVPEEVLSGHVTRFKCAP